MGHVIVEVNGRPYTMQCPDGEEDHLRELAQLLDAEVARIKQSVGTVGDIRLLVMSGLMVADRLSEAIKRIENLEDELRALHENQAAMEADMTSLETQVSNRLAAASHRLEAAARDLSS
jgi:cell division protein ZapA